MLKTPQLLRDVFSSRETIDNSGLKMYIMINAFRCWLLAARYRVGRDG